MADSVVHLSTPPEEPGRRHFHCPGCGEAHYVTEGWTWNGSLDKPTFTPSILVEGYRFKRDGSDGSEAFRCHSFVVLGRIQYLGDCTHELAGQTVDLPPWRADSI